MNDTGERGAPRVSAAPSDRSEPDAVTERYARRAPTDRYNLLKPDVWQTVQERQRALLRLFVRLG